MIGYVLWVMLAYLAKRGGGGIEAAGQSFLEVAVSYLVARVFFKTPQQVVRLLLIVGVLIAILGLLAIPEAISHQRYLHNIPRMVTGIIYDMQADIRLGLLRAASTFENPILFGLFSATFLSLVWYSTLSLGARVALVAGIALSTFLSLSSAAILLLVMQIFLIMAEHASRRIPRRAPMILGMILMMVVLIETFSNRGVVRLIASKLTFNPHTGYYRLLQWEYSIDDVYANPMFGIKFENWTRPFWMTDSIDNNWLFMAMNSGVPAVFIIFVVMGLLAFRMYKRRKTMQDAVLRSLLLGWIIGMSALFLGGWTVALFGKMLPAFFFLIGLGAALVQMPDTADAEDGEVSDPPPQQTGRRHSRFATTPGRRMPTRMVQKPAVATRAARPIGSTGSARTPNRFDKA